MPKGHIRKLFYHPDKQRLFFTTTLQNAVQSFSLQNFELLDAAPNHPSPPTVFAVSPACDLLVSASTDPPTVYLSRITCKQPPLLFIPDCSNTPVVSICFHPSRANVFALGFQDGTIAAYNASVLPVSQMTEERFSYARIYGEISHLASLHHHEIDASSSSAKSSASKYNTEIAVPTVSGMQFIKNRACSVVSVGSDRNCFIVDFQSNGRRAAKVVCNWNLQAAATSLAILNIEDDLVQTDGPGSDVEIDDLLLAIGKNDGSVYIYEQTGRLLATKGFSKDGRILDLEWVQRSKDESQPKSDQQRSRMELQSNVPQANRPEDVSEIPSSPPRLLLKSSRSPIGSRIMVKLHVKDPPPDDYLLRKKSPAQDMDEHPDQNASALDGNATSLPEKHPIDGLWQDVVPEGNRNVDSGIKTKARDDDISNTKPEGSAGNRRRSRQSSRTTARSSGSSMSGRKIKKPITPLRPLPRPGGKLALRRVESARDRRTSKTSQSPIPTEVVNAVTMGEPQFNRINDEPLRRPNMHMRHRSSKISPLTEAAEPHLPATSSIPPSPLAYAPLTPRSPTTPVQFNRLARSHLDADTGSSMSRTSVYHDSNTKYSTEIPAKTKLNSKPVARMGTVFSSRARLVERDVVTPAAMSDSGTSASSILDWTPSQVQRPTYVPHSRMVSHNLRSMPEEAAVPHGYRKAAEQFHNRDSDASVTSHVDWHKPIAVKGLKILHPIEEIENSSTSEKAEQPVKTTFNTPLPEIAPLNNPKIRKQQTVINLKEKPEKLTDPQPEKKTITPVKPTADTNPPEPRKSDLPGPSRLHSPTTREAIREEDLQLPPMSPPPSIPRSLNPLTTRRFSQLKGIMSLPQIRSSGSTAGSQSLYTIEDVIRIECAAVCNHIDAGFQEQRAWLQGFMKEQNWYAQRLEEENRLFREELARLRRGC